MTRATAKGGSEAAMGPTPAVSVAGGAATAAIVEHLDDAVLPNLLVRAVGTLIEFEYSAILIYRRRATPIHVHDTFPSPEARVGLLNYVKSTYILNPFYAAYEGGLKTGVYRMRDLAPDGFIHSRSLKHTKVHAASTEEIGFLTHGWPAGRNELCIALVLPNHECAEISLSRKSAQGGFSDDDLARLAPVIPFLEAAFRHHWKRARGAHSTTVVDTDAETAFKTFGGTRLSPRERQLAQLLLRGHSTVSVGLHLGISPTTVKTHRKNLYAKLGIGTQFELFSMFRDSLGGKRRR